MSAAESFLRRWSRLKHEAAAVPAPPTVAAQPPAAPAPELPPVDSLSFDSDFSLFARRDVEASLRRTALKKLFQSEHFNQMDGLDVYIEDYNTFQPLDEDAVKNLAHARDMLFGEPENAQPPAALAGDDAQPQAAVAVPDAQADTPSPAAPAAADQPPDPPAAGEASA